MRQTTPLPHIDKGAGPAWNGKIGNWDASSFAKVFIVLHTMEGFLLGTDSEFGDPNHKHSAHYGIGQDGAIHQYVSEAATAYHCGVYNGAAGAKVYNQNSIGIEHEDKNVALSVNDTTELYKKSAALVADICKGHNIPCDREHIRKHNEVSSTACPGDLDVDKIVVMAQALLRQQTEPVSEPTLGMTTDEKNALDVLRTMGPVSGNLEGMVRGLIDTSKSYRELTAPDASGHPPVVISADHFVDITIKSQNLDKVAAYFGYTEVNEVDPTFGEKLVDQIRVLDAKSEPKITVSGGNGGSGLDRIIGGSSTTVGQPLNSDQVTISATGNANLLSSLLGKIASIYTALFISKEVTK